MLIFDQLKKDDPQLRWLAFMVLGGMLILFAGLWWVQVVSTRFYRDKLEVQSIRTVRLPAVRGRILDRNGLPLTVNEPHYNVSLYLEELSGDYRQAFSVASNSVRQTLRQQIAAQEQASGRKLTPVELKKFALTQAYRDELGREVRYQVTSNLLAQLGSRLNEPIQISQKDFERHYNKSLAMPLPVVTHLNAAQIAMFEEQSLHTPAMDLEPQSTRVYPNGDVAAHVLGYVHHDMGESDTEVFNYRLADYEGVTGIEKLFDNELRGTPGVKSVLVNNKGYRHGETVISPAEPGDDVSLTIDLDIQKTADEALANEYKQTGGAILRGAIVVMDVRNGDVLAMASWPTYNPSYFAEPPPVDAWKELMAQWTNDDLQLQDDHALQGEYAPGSVFKIVVGLAALERGLDPAQILTSPGYVPIPGRPKGMGDTAKEGDYDFNRAMAKSCNYYFVTITTNDPKAGVLPKIIELGQRLHFGERTGLIPHEEDGGYFPTTGEITEHNWHIGNTANICIGQDKVAVTPLQIAVMVSAVANGGRVYYPRLVSKITPYGSDEPSRVFPAGRLRDTLDVSPRSLGIVHDAMRFEVTSPEGTGKEANVDGMRVAGKTGTAQYEKNGHVDKSLQITWFASFAPVDEPRYAVVAMAVGGSSGGGTCAPLAGEVYKTILKKERQALTATTAMAEMAK